MCNFRKKSSRRTQYMPLHCYLPLSSHGVTAKNNNFTAVANLKSNESASRNVFHTNIIADCLNNVPPVRTSRSSG
jgi:hypothetical protein